jgi:mannosyltransferase OCH1-like enzyme
MSNFPKTINYIWINFKNELDQNPIIPQKYLENIKNTQRLNPDYKIKIWNGYDCDQLIKKYFPDKVKFYWNLPYPIQRCDYIRIIILYIYGGIYSDMDRISLKSYDIILEQYSNYNVIFPIDKFNFLNNDIIFVKPKSDFLLYCINNFKQLNTKIYFIDVVCTCGPAALQYYRWKYKGSDKIIYLKNILLPCTWCNCDKNMDEVISLTTIDCSWLSDSIIHKIIYFIVSNIQNIIIILLIIYTLYQKYK